MFVYDEELSDVLEEAHTRRSWWLEYIADRDEMKLRAVDSKVLFTGFHTLAIDNERELAVA